ncbi:MAG: hypothetical protein HPY58_01565 [Firmicutes bacterium]|nr:hypothetical protein [Bacillota bacterium]
MSALYHIPMPLLFITANCGSGCYDPAINAIFLPKFSVTTLAHEFRHALQNKKPIRVWSVAQAEEDARGWELHRLETIPGVGKKTAELIIAEVGTT